MEWIFLKLNTIKGRQGTGVVGGATDPTEFRLVYGRIILGHILKRTVARKLGLMKCFRILKDNFLINVKVGFKLDCTNSLKATVDKVKNKFLAKILS